MSADASALCTDAESCTAVVPIDPLNVMLLISSLEHGGAERQVIELANHLDPDRFNVTVCSLSSHVPLAANLRNRDRRLVVIEKRRKYDFGLIGRVAREMRARRIDLVHAFLFDAEMTARMAARSGGVRAVVASERNTDYAQPLSHRIGKRLTAKRFDLMIANSEAGKRFNVRTNGVDEARICVIRNGVDVSRFQPMDRTALRAKHGISADAPLVGMIATFKRQKGHADFFRMAANVAERFPEAQFLCVGEPMRDNQQGAEDYHREIQSLVDSLGVRERTIFWGYRADMPEVYNLCDVVVLPSSREGTPNVLLEAMACGVPVVANDVADNRQVVPDGQAGFVVPLGDVSALTDRVRRLLGDAELRRRMGTAGVAWVDREHSLAGLAERTGEAYLRLVQRMGAGRARA